MRDFDSIKQKEMGSIENRIRHIYNRGYEDGYKDGRENIVDTYDAGLNEAWEYARKIACEVHHGGLFAGDLEEIFGTRFTTDIFRDNTASEAIAKIKEKQKQDDEIKVGDEVYVLDKNRTYVVTRITDAGIAVLIAQSGCYSEFNKCNLKKTGRHFPEIAEVLRKMQEGTDV